MNVTYVCRGWRVAALRSRKLWTFVDFSNRGRTKVSLDRAKGEPLSIRAVVRQHNIRMLKSALTTAYRIDTVHLHSSVHNILPLLETLAHPHPTLTNLVVDVVPETLSALSYPHPGFPLSVKELGLQSAELNAAPLYLLSYRCPLLTRLSLRNLPRNARQSDLLRLLSEAPQLQYLTICECSIAGESSATPLLLQNLRLLKIGGSLRQVADFLEIFTLPPSCQLSCSLTHLDDLSDSLWRLCQSIGTHSYTSSHDIPLETLVLTCTETSSRFTASYEPNPDFRQSIRIRAFGHATRPTSAIFDIAIGSESRVVSDDFIIMTLTGIWRALFLTNVHTLSLQNIDIITQRTWSQFLRTLPQLRVLDIRGHAPSGLCWALLLDVLSSDTNAPRFLAPRLDDIYLYGMDLSSGGLMLAPKGQTNSHTDVDDSSFLDVLVAVLEHRQQHKLRLRSLTMTRCEEVVEKRLGELKRMTSHFIWDFREKVKETEVGYRNMYPDVPRGGLRHYNRLEALLS